MLFPMPTGNDIRSFSAPQASVRPLIAQDIRVVYFDPKGDQQIFTKIYEVAREEKRLNDLMLVTPIFPEYSAVVDPMVFNFMPDELVGHIVSGIMGGREPFTGTSPRRSLRQ